MIDLLDPTNVITRMFNAKKYNEMYSYCKNLLEQSSYSYSRVLNEVIRKAI